MRAIIDLESSKIIALVSRPVLKDPLTLIDLRRDEVKLLKIGSHKAMTALLKESRSEIKEIKAQVNALSPLATLKRGYAVVQKRGRVLLDAKEVTPTEPLHVTLAKGEITVEVISKRREKGK